MSARPLTEIARELRARVEGQQAAWELLRTADGELQPWTPEAEVAFGGLAPYTGVDVRLRHHRAVCLHTRAYDLQRAGEGRAALPYWRVALREWSALHADDAFWDRFADRLPKIDGRPVPREVVDAARDALPGRLLDVHVSLARSLRASDLKLAARHGALIRGSGFPDDAVAAARAAMVVGLDVRVDEAVELRKPGPLFEEVAEWLVVDPDSPELTHMFVALAVAWGWRLWKEQGGWALVGNMLDRVDELMPPDGAAVAALTDDDRARLIYWRGLQLHYGTPTPRIGDSVSTIALARATSERAEANLRESLVLSPDVRLHPWSAELKIADALAEQAICARLAGQDDDARRLAEAAMALDPECERAITLLEKLGPAEVPRGAVPPAPLKRPVRRGATAAGRFALGDIAAIDRHLDAGDLAEAVAQLEYLEEVPVSAASRLVLVEYPAVGRLGEAVRDRPALRLRFDAVLARLRVSDQDVPRRKRYGG